MSEQKIAKQRYKLVPDYEVGNMVLYGGEEYRIFAKGDRPGTFDICHPTDTHRDRWISVPPEMLEPVFVPPLLTDEQMPPLPKPYYPQWSHSNEFAAFTADQLSAHARAVEAAVRKQILGNND